MKLLRCHIAGFGKLADLPLSFAPGLNVVFASNEAGKSTLQRFLMAALYGQLRSDIKVQRRLDPWVEMFKPWRAAEYGGVLWIELAGGRELEIHRAFGREENRFEILTAGGEDITRQYETQRNGDVIFVASHVGLSKELFESVAVVRESETAELRHREPLRDRIANLAQSGDEKLSVRLSLVKLEDALETIGSDRAPTRPYRQALDRLQELREERADLEDRRLLCRSWVQEKFALERQMRDLETALAEAGRGVIEARWREAQLRVQTLTEIDEEIRALGEEIETLHVSADFPMHQLEDLNRLAADVDNLQWRLNELGNQIRAVQTRRVQGETELRSLGAYESLLDEVKPETITEWFVGYLGISRQRDELQRSMGRLLEEADALEAGLANLSPPLQEERIDWERKARQAAEEENAASQQSLALADRVSQGKAEFARFTKKAGQQTLIAAGALLAMLVTGAGGLVSILPSFLAFVLAGCAALLGIGFLMAASKSKGAAQQARQAYETLGAGLDRLREQAEAASSEMEQAVSASGFASVEEFLAGARQAIIDRQRLRDLTPRIQETDQQFRQIQGEAEICYSRLQQCLARAGLSCAPGNLKGPVDTLRANMRRYGELLAGLRRTDEEIAAHRREIEAVGARARELQGEMQAILAAAGVDSPEAFRTACKDCRRLLDLRARLEARSREFERLRGALTFDQWKSRLEELEVQRGGDVETPRESTVSARQGPRLPYLPTVEEAEQEEKGVSARLAAAREEHAGLVERVRQAFHNYRAPAEIEEDLAMAEAAAGTLTLNRNALSLALESIRNLARLQQESCAPQLNRAVEERFSQICPDRYEEVKIDPDFKIQVREKGTLDLRAADQLSRGTQDQLYFSVRFGILDLLGDAHEPCPCLLDEPFVAYDRRRMEAAFGILEQEAGRRQLILFTCREVVRDLALRHGANLLSL